MILIIDWLDFLYDRLFCFRVFVSIVTITLGLELIDHMVARSAVMAVFPGNKYLWIAGLVSAGSIRMGLCLHNGRRDTLPTHVMDGVFCLLWTYIVIYCYRDNGWILRQFGCAFSLPTAIAESVLLFRRGL